MPHFAMHVIDDPDQALHAINRQRTMKMVVALVALMATLIAIVGGLAIAYSDAPDARPGLQSR